MTEQLDNDEINEYQIEQYLKPHPQFFEHHPNLLKQLHLKHDSGAAISLIERQNHILRKENGDLIDRLNQFINVAQRNDKLFLNLQSLVFELIACQTLNDMTRVLNNGLTDRFDVDEVQVVLTHQVNGDGDLWLYCDKETLASYYPASVNDLKSQCGVFTETARQLLFGEQPIKSVACGAISMNKECVGLLALGSNSAEHFRLGTDTLFLNHLAKIVSQLLVRF